MKKQTISSMVAAALVVSAVPAAVADAAATSTVSISKVVALDSATVQITYTQNGKTKVSKVKTTKVIKHGATTVQFRLQGKSYTKKLSKAFENANYVSAMNQIVKAQDAINKGADADAIQAIKKASTFFTRLKTTEVSSAQYKKLSQQITSLQTILADLEAPIAAADFSAADVLKQSIEKMNAVKSMDSNVSMTMKISLMNEALNLNMYGTMSTISNPILAKMDLTMDLGELGKDTMQMYMEESNGKYTTYTQVGKSEWIKQTMDAGNQANAYDTQVYLEALKDVKAVGKQTLQGKELYVVEGVVSGDVLEALIQQSGAMDIVAVSTEDADMQAMIQSMLTNLGNIKMRMWIDSDFYNVKYEMDMTDLVKKMMENIANSGQMVGEDQELLKMIQFSEVSMSMTNSNFNGVEAFTIPAEVKNGAVSVNQ